MIVKDQHCNLNENLIRHYLTEFAWNCLPFIRTVGQMIYLFIFFVCVCGSDTAGMRCQRPPRHRTWNRETLLKFRWALLQVATGSHGVVTQLDRIPQQSKPAAMFEDCCFDLAQKCISCQTKGLMSHKFLASCNYCIAESWQHCFITM